MPRPDPIHTAVIRPIQTADWPIVRELTTQMLTEAPQAFGETLADAQARSSATWTQFVGHFVNNAYAGAFVAEDEVGACGFVGVEAADPRPPQGTVLVSRLWVAQRQRGTGLGKALMEAATHWAITHGAEHMALGVTEINRSVLKFYQHLGYRDTHLRALWPADPTKNVIILGRRLKP